MYLETNVLLYIVQNMKSTWMEYAQSHHVTGKTRKESEATLFLFC